MNTLIVFTSMTGTIEKMAHALAEEIEKTNNEVVVKDAFDSFGCDVFILIWGFLRSAHIKHVFQGFPSLAG
ncbi:flavodoxin domain-containing protein [Robertmurraya sp. 2P01SA]|uniref:flavodoxin domain-containing protein n=1 Tax=Robertmurraya sp. 2P01SA TaxID=3132300 RepID=UPI0039A5AB69